MLQTTFTLAVILTTASALQSLSVHQLAKRFGACSKPTAVSLYLDSLSGALDVVAPRSSAFGGYLDGLPCKTFSTPTITVVPTPTKSSGTGFGSYLNGLPGKTFTTPVVAVQATPAASSPASSNAFGDYLDGLKGKTFATPVITVAVLPKASSGVGIGSYLDGLPGKTFTTPVFAKTAPVLAGKGMGGYLDSLPGTTFNTPAFSTPAPATATPKPAAKSRTGFGSYIDGL